MVHNWLITTHPGEVKLVYEACRFYQAWSPDLPSAWCVAFTPDDLQVICSLLMCQTINKMNQNYFFIQYVCCIFELVKNGLVPSSNFWDSVRYPPKLSVNPQLLQVMEYSYDLKDYYEVGYGHDINYQMACPLVQDVFQHFRSALVPFIVSFYIHLWEILWVYKTLLFWNDIYPYSKCPCVFRSVVEGKGGPKGLFYFTHSTALLTVGTGDTSSAYTFPFHPQYPVHSAHSPT